MYAVCVVLYNTSVYSHYVLISHIIIMALYPGIASVTEKAFQ